MLFEGLKRSLKKLSSGDQEVLRASGGPGLALPFSDSSSTLRLHRPEGHIHCLQAAAEMHQQQDMVLQRLLTLCLRMRHRRKTSGCAAESGN